MNEMTKDVMEGLDVQNKIDELEWNKTRKWRKRNEISKIIIHQSLSDGKLENINHYLISPGNHISPKTGCPHICYHIVIDKQGTIILCNDFDDMTWHTKKHNVNGLSICVLGNFIGTGWNKGHEPSEEQMKSLDKLLDHLMENLSLNSKDIYGHYHFGKPACPGKTITELIESIRREVRADQVDEMPSSFKRLDTISDIQKALLMLGFHLDKYGSDGILGEETKLAICHFQIKYDLPLNGVADEKTRNSLIVKLSEHGL